METIRFAKFRSYSHTRKVGFMDVDGECQSVRFDMTSVRKIIAGIEKPEFAPADPSKIDLGLAEPGDDMVVTVEVSYKLHVIPDHRILRRIVTITRWAPRISYDLALRMIEERPVYEVVEFVFYNNKPISTNQRSVINHGTAVQLQAVYPRGSEDDPLAPEKQFLGFTRRRRFYRIYGNERVQCPDPRPLAPGQKEEPFRRTNEQGELILNDSEIALGLCNLAGKPSELTLRCAA